MSFSINDFNHKNDIGGAVMLASGNGFYTPITAAADNSLKVTSSFATNGGNLDAFGRLRTSLPKLVFDSKQIGDARQETLYWDNAQISGSGTSTQTNRNRASTILSVGNTTAGIRVRQTKRHFDYKAGKSQLILGTFIMGAGTANIIRRVGYFNENNGIFLEQRGVITNVAIRTFSSGASVDNVVAQSSWNIDKLDGSGTSGFTLDLSKSQILLIDFEWLGVGIVRIGFVIDGRTIYCHEFLNANNLSVVYMSTPNLPFRYELTNDGAGVASNLECICCSIASEGGDDELGAQFSIDRGSSPLTTSNDALIYPTLAIKLQTGSLGTKIELTNMSIVCATASTFRWGVYYDPGFTGTAPVFSGLANSSVDYCNTFSNATTITGGTLIAGGYGQQSNNAGDLNLVLKSFLSLGSSITGYRDTFVLGISRLSAQAESYYTSLTWTEIV